MQSRASLGRTHFFPAIIAQGSGTGLAPEDSIARQTARESQKGRIRNIIVLDQPNDSLDRAGTMTTRIMSIFMWLSYPAVMPPIGYRAGPRSSFVGHSHICLLYSEMRITLPVSSAHSNVQLCLVPPHIDINIKTWRRSLRNSRQICSTMKVEFGTKKSKSWWILNIELIIIETHDACCSLFIRYQGLMWSTA